jgi:RNA polymerase sigma factor (TIGR02999 family)
MAEDVKSEISPDLDTWHELVPLVYHELRALARRQLRRERDSHTLNTTALVHEAYLKLANQRRVPWLDRTQLFAIAARVMRRILIDYARQHQAEKRGGRSEKVPIDGLDPAVQDRVANAEERAELLTALDEALTRLAAIDPRLAQVVECRFFGGLSEEETAMALGVTARTVRRDWVKAKNWLRSALDT